MFEPPDVQETTSMGIANAQSAALLGDVTTRKISIEEGSVLKGVFDIRYQGVNRGKSAV